MEVSINFPQKAYDSFRKLGSLEEFKTVYSFVGKILSKISDPVDRARKTHQYVSSYTNEVLSNPTARKMVTCHRGCSACCHTQVSATSDEAALLAKRVVDEEMEIDLKKLYIQGNTGNSAREWFQLPYEIRGCVFLDKNGGCRVYEDRPSVCRTNNVLSNPKNCSTVDGVEQPIRLLNTTKADMAIIAAFEIADEAGALPNLLWKAFDNVGSRNEEIVSKKQIKKITKKVKSKKLKNIRDNLFKIADIL